MRVATPIDPRTLTLTQADGRWTGSLDVLIVGADAQGKVVGSLTQSLNLGMSQALYDQARATGIPYAVTLPLTAPARRVKVVVYNYEGDRLGVMSVDVK